MKDNSTPGQKLVAKERIAQCRAEIRKLNDFVKKRKYYSAMERVRVAEGAFNSLPYKIQRENNALRDKLLELSVFLQDKDDEPSSFPKEITLEEAISGIKSSRLRLIYNPILEVVRCREDLSFKLGHRIDKNPKFTGASLFLVGENEFSGESESGYDNYGRPENKITIERYIFAIQLYDLNKFKL